jgi:hypothetical protein
MPVADLCCMVYKQVWETIRETPAVQQGGAGQWDKSSSHILHC